MSVQVVQQRSRGFICVNAHPAGCGRNVQDQIAYARRNAHPSRTAGIRNVLVIGASTGYGLAARIASGWGMGCRTLGVFLEKPPRGRRTASAGYYNSVALERAAKDSGLWARSVNGDAYSDEVKDEVVRIAANSMGPIDLVVYSLASPKRTNPRMGVTHSSSLKPIGSSYSGKTIDLARSRVKAVAVGPAESAEIEATVAVMGGEDWMWWVQRLEGAGVLAEGARTVAFSYHGPELTWPIYKHGTIGAAKRHLSETADRLNARLERRLGGAAWVSVNKAVVTQASAAIPVVPLYISILFRVMKDRGVHEGCIEQMSRLFSGHLCRRGGPELDENRLIRLDDLEMRADIQRAVAEVWPDVTTATLHDLTDYEGFRREFNGLFGFALPGVEYALPVETQLLLD